MSSDDCQYYEEDDAQALFDLDGSKSPRSKKSIIMDDNGDEINIMTTYEN